MVNKAIVASLLLGAAMAVPYPPSATSNPKQHVPGKHVYPHKKVNGGNYQPSHTSKSTASKTSAAPAVYKNQDSKRTSGETVNNAVARFDNTNILDGVGDGVDSYTLYLGDGTTGSGWPDQSRWVSFENMFNNYKNIMFSSCENIAGQANDSGPEVGAIWDGIQQAAAATGVDHRFILAVIMQESGGCVRVQTTNFGVRNPGLMQDHNGAATCNENGNVQNPCPSATIYQMITDGTAGTDSGDGLANCINESGSNDVSAFYRAARIYNSGSISSTGNLQSNIATHCYASDIANRLTGWVNAPSACTCDSDPNSCGVVPF
ncbi:glycoside hydrolase [Trichoderma arundinaceum]|uniref:Glycoside hydrolase n=1 Tax=Trichoderma arundinaceum TaxID=490622 RepID=A0A395N9A5_TRIAR|nr:glycoside hydrolase [Trichoderma arundinaceum]